jgi:FkbM family methyltransferase
MLRALLPAPIKAVLRPIYYGSTRLFHAIVTGFLWLVRTLMGRRMFFRLCHVIREKNDMVVDVATIKFDATDFIPYHRAVTILTKEPDTIAWIDDYIKEGDVLFDIGANIGVFSLYAAKTKNARAFAFEPFAGNYVVLNRNIYLNNLSDRITALNIALHKETTLSHLNVSEFWAGKAGHSFNDPMGSGGGIFKPKFLQGVIGMSLDDFIETFDAPHPNHIKIDVDGNEKLIIEGMKKTMADSRLKSVAIEIDNAFGDHLQALEMIKAHGFEVLPDEKYINRAYLAVRTMQNYFLVRGLPAD